MTSRSDLRDAGAAFARDLVAGGDVDHVERQIGQFGAERGGEVVAARFDENDVEVGERAVEARHRLEVDRGVLADRGVRAAAGLDADDALGRERFVAHQELRVLLGVDVVGDDAELVFVAQRAAQRQRQRGLAGTDRAADADPQRVGRSFESRGLRFPGSWILRNETGACTAFRGGCSAIARPGREVGKRSSSSATRRPPRAMPGSSALKCASRRWPSVWPSGTAFTAAMTWFSSHAHR